jgi:diphthine-ammonia ligase
MRLGLVPLTYLWQRERTGLLKEMIAAGVDAVLVKVAGAGLDPDRHLGTRYPLSIVHCLV